MFEFLKNLVRKNEPVRPAAPAPIASVPPSRPVSAPVTPAGPPPAKVESVQIRYFALLPKLPVAIQQHFKGDLSTAVLDLPLGPVLEQLRKGKVQITLAQLRQFSSPGAISAATDNDPTPIELPLPEILSRLKPDALGRSGQRRVEVSPDIPTIFSPDGARLAAPEPTVAPSPIVEPRVSTPAAPPITPPPAPAPAPPVTVAPPPVIHTPIAFKPTAEVVPDSAPEPDSIAIPLSQMASHWAALGKTELVNLNAGTAWIPASILESKLKSGKASFPWSQFRPWLRGVSLPALPDATTVELPLNIVAPLFLSRRGAQSQKRVAVDQTLPDLFVAKTAPVQTVPPPIAPPAMEAAKAAPASIPAAQPTISAQPTVLAPTTAAPPVVTSIPVPAIPPVLPSAAPAGQRPLLEFGEIFGQPQKKDWPLAEVIQKAAALRGISGALLATGDGLLIASQWPGDVKGEALAGFIPQMFMRTVQYTSELKLGQPEQFTLLIENLPLQIFKTGANYFAVLGKPGEPLPKAQLTALAQRLTIL